MSRFANLSERLSADLPADPTRPEDEEDETTTTSTDKDKEKTPMTEEIEKAKAEGHDAGFKAANDRMNTVFASEYYEGREEAAKAMLANPKFTAEDITGILAKSPKIEPSTIGAEAVAAEATDSDARDEMKKAIATNSNSTVQAGSGDTAQDDAAPTSKAAAILADQRAFTGRKPAA